MIYPDLRGPLGWNNAFVMRSQTRHVCLLRVLRWSSNFLHSMHGIIFSRSISRRNMFLAYLEALSLWETFCNICVCVFAIFCMHRVPSSRLSTVIIICDGEKQFSRRSILFQAFCCGFQQPVLECWELLEFCNRKERFWSKIFTYRGSITRKKRVDAQLIGHFSNVWSNLHIHLAVKIIRSFLFHW